MFHGGWRSGAGPGRGPQPAAGRGRVGVGRGGHRGCAPGRGGGYRDRRTPRSRDEGPVGQTPPRRRRSRRTTQPRVAPSPDLAHYRVPPRAERPPRPAAADRVILGAQAGASPACRAADGGRSGNLAPVRNSTRSGAYALARVLNTIGLAIVAVIVIYILLTFLEANPDNTAATLVRRAGRVLQPRPGQPVPGRRPEVDDRAELRGGRADLAGDHHRAGAAGPPDRLTRRTAGRGQPSSNTP